MYPVGPTRFAGIELWEPIGRKRSTRMNDIVVGVDQSSTARSAADTAAALASDCGVNLHLVMCVKSASNEEVGIGSDSFIVNSDSDAESFLLGLVRDLPNDQITTSVGHGDPGKFICDVASRLDAKMIVVGNRRVQGVSRVLGSIASDVTRHAPCDVLIAHTVG